MEPRIAATAREQRDVLELLTARIPLAYRKGAVIYSESNRLEHLHLVVSGRVTVTRRTSDHPIVIDIYGPDDFFGECALLNVQTLPEQAIALEDARVMRWSRKDIEQLVLQRPQLGLALMQMLAGRSMEFAGRLQNCLGTTTGGRVLRSLIRFSERSGANGASGRVHIAPMSHQLLSEYVGASREIVTQYMLEFRRQGILNYSHQEIVLMPQAFEAVGSNSYGGVLAKNANLERQAG